VEHAGNLAWITSNTKAAARDAKGGAAGTRRAARGLVVGHRQSVEEPARCPKKKGSLRSPSGGRDFWHYAFSWSPIGSERSRLPVALKIALYSAGANGGTPGSPTPVAWTENGCSTMCVTTISGKLLQRATS
jgi:hypothetical protein